MKPCFASAAKLGSRSDIVPDVNHVQAGRVLELPSPVLGDERIDVCELIHGFLAGFEISTHLAGFFSKTPRFVSCRTKGSSIGANNGSSSCSGSGVATGRAAVYSIGSASAFFLSLL